MDLQERVESDCAGRLPLQVTARHYSGLECHTSAGTHCSMCFRFVLFAKTLHGWRVFISLQRKKKTKMQRAQSLGIIYIKRECSAGLRFVFNRFVCLIS